MNNQHLIFGTGPLGKSTGRTLLEHGQHVRMVNRSGKAEGLPGIEIIKGDANDLEFTRNITQGIGTVYQCAQPAYHQWPVNFPRLQASILEGATANGARLEIADKLYMYGPPNGQPLREDHPYNTQTKKGLVRAEMARTALEAHKSGKAQVALVRGSNFFGPEDPTMSELIFRPALQGKAANLLGRLDQAHTFTYAPDFGRALATLGMVDSVLEEKTFGRAWHVPSPAAVTQAEFMRLLEVQLGRKVKSQVAGAAILRILGLFNPSMREAIEMLYEWNQPFEMDSSDFQRTFGLEPTPLKDAIQATLEWNRQQLALPAHLALA